MAVSTAYVIDEQRCFVDGLQAAFLRHDGPRIVGTASTLEAGMREASGDPPDILLVDPSVSDFNGVNFRNGVAMMARTPRTAALTHLCQNFYIQQAYAVGMTGYILRSSEPGDIVAAVEDVLAGEIYLDPGIMARLMPTATTVALTVANLASMHVDVSRREMSVLRLTALGHTCREIASTLELSPKSVETYKARALQKLGLSSRVDVVKFASLCGWFASRH